MPIILASPIMALSKMLTTLRRMSRRNQGKAISACILFFLITKYKRKISKKVQIAGSIIFLLLI